MLIAGEWLEKERLRLSTSEQRDVVKAIELSLVHTAVKKQVY